MNYRPQRVGKLIREELNKIINREIEIPGALATITDITIDGKLERAEVNVSILPQESAEKTFSFLKRSQGYLQRLLMKQVQIKPFPRIEFRLDHGNEEAAKIEKLLIQDNNK